MTTTFVEPRVPVSEQEAYAWGYMIGYTGEVPEVMRAAFDYEERDFDIAGWGTDGAPEFLSDEQAREFSSGYWAGVSMYSDHAHPEDREA